MTYTHKTMQLIHFSHMFNDPQDVFYGAYGHEITDSDVFTNSGIMPNRVYLIDEEGRMFNMKTKERTSYKQQSEMVDTNYPKWNPFNPEPFKAKVSAALDTTQLNQMGPFGPYDPIPYPYPDPEPSPGPFPYPYPDSMERCYFGEDERPWSEGGANDVVVVGQNNGEIKSTQFNVKLPRMGGAWGNRRLYVNDKMIRLESRMDVTPTGFAYFHRHPYSCSFTPEELRYMDLMPGRNRAWLRVDKPHSDRTDMWHKEMIIPFDIYFYNETSRFVAFDIDNPMGEDNEHGYFMPRYELEYTRPDAIEMLDRIYRNGYTPVYFTSRPHTESRDVRYHLFQKLRNVNGFSLPMGPLFMGPRAYRREMTQTHKTMQLIHFSHMFNDPQDVFYGAYGHENTDSYVYRDAEIMPSRVYLIDQEGKMFNMETKEETSYRQQSEMVDSNYPQWDPYHPEPYNPNVNPRIAKAFARFMFRLAQS